MIDRTRRQFLHCGIAGAAVAGLPLPGWSQNQKPKSAEVNVAARVWRNQPAGVADRVGIDPKGLDQLARLFGEMLDKGLHPGAQLAVYREGELVIELGGGRDGPAGNPVAAETLFQIRSTTKALTTIVMLMLHDRGRFKFEDRVAKHWPRFGRNGKDEITIAQVMGHRAGFPDGPPIPYDKMGDREAVAAAVEAMRPIWPPGSANGYHAATIGWVCDELVYRWEGRSISQFLKSEVTQPLGIKDVYIGLTEKEFPRMAKMVVDEEVRQRQAQRARFSDFINTYEGIRLPLAWVGGVATARDLANLMNVLAFEGAWRNRTFFSKQTLELASTPTNPPGVADLRLQQPIRWGLGLILGDTPDIYGTPPHRRAVGHAGGGAVVAWADPARRLTAAFLCNRMVTRSGPQGSREIGDHIYGALRQAGNER